MYFDFKREGLRITRDRLEQRTSIFAELIVSLKFSHAFDPKTSYQTQDKALVV